MKRRFLSLLLTGAFALLGVTSAYAEDLVVGSGVTVNVNDTTLTVNDVTISSGGVLNGGSGTINVSGNWTNSGTFTAGTGTVNFVDGTSPATVAGDTTFYNLSMTTTSAKQITLTAGTTQTVSASITLQGAVSNLLVLRSSSDGTQASINLQTDGTQTVSYVDVQDNNATGNVLGEGTAASLNSADSGNNTYWFVESLVIADGETVDIGADTVTYNNLTINSGGKIKGGSGTINIRRNWTNYGTFDAESSTVNVKRNWTNFGTFTGGTGTVNVDGDLTNSGTIDGGSGTIDVIGDFTVSSGGVLNGGTGTVSVDGDIDISSGGTIEAGGSWTNSGTFDAGTGTVNFVDGTSPATITGDTTFYGLNMTTSSGKQINLATGSIQTIIDALTLLGAANNLLTLRSTSDGTQTSINLKSGATQTVSYVDVQDNNAVGEIIGQDSAATLNSVDSGNNINWFAEKVIPTLSEWGMIILTILMLATGLYYRRPAGFVS